MHVPYNTRTVSLTCKVEHAKPPADLRWFRVYDDGGHKKHAENASSTNLLLKEPGELKIIYIARSIYPFSIRWTNSSAFPIWLAGHIAGFDPLISFLFNKSTFCCIVSPNYF